MRGRKPETPSLAADDVPILQRIARSRWLPWFQIQRARVVLTIAAGQRTEAVATLMPIFYSDFPELLPLQGVINARRVCGTTLLRFHAHIET